MDMMDELRRRGEEINEYLMQYLERGEYTKLIEAVKHYPSAGGKRLRPVMAVVSAEAVGGEGSRAIPFGCCLEIIHNFTLVHDDVMDEDPVRRGRTALHIKYDIPTAIIAGDALFARAFEVLAETEVDDGRLRQLLSLVAKTVWTVAEGQQMDIDNESRDTVSVSEYLRMIEKKTAVLFSCAAEGGAIIGGGTKKQVTGMREYARLLGISFQIWDDVLGITADEKTLGKPVGSDIRKGKRTLIVLHALENLDPSRRSALLSILGKEDASDGEVRRAIDIMERAGSIEYAREQALEHVERAKALLSCLDESGGRTFLLRLADFAVGRAL